ncbi:MAG: SOS response-associated peptidase [Candidatus Sulfotelmatobacter sp.]
MCGRYRLTAKERYLRDYFGLEEDPPWQPRWNIAPTQQVAAIRQHPAEPRRIFSLMRWGLVPYWANDQSFGLKTINAMSETAAQKPAFRDAFRRRRCLLPADGFFEWKKTGSKHKQPYNIGLATGSVFAFAGLWDLWRDPNNHGLETCTILTTRPNSLVAEVHDRMPAILDPDDYERWLDPGITNPEMILDCLKPFDATPMSKYPVSPRVNCPENDDEECAREVPAENSALTLF